MSNLLCGATEKTVAGLNGPLPMAVRAAMMTEYWVPLRSEENAICLPVVWRCMVVLPGLLSCTV